MHCPVVIELAGSTETPLHDSVVVPKLKKWNREVQKLYTSEINLKELFEIENSLQEKPCSLETLNAKLFQVIKDSATKVGALHEVKKSEKKTKFWFDRECQEQRTFYRCIRREAVRENTDEERKSGFEVYRSFLKRKKLLASERLNTELQTKKIKDPKEYLNFVNLCAFEKLLYLWNCVEIFLAVAATAVLIHFSTDKRL